MNVSVVVPLRDEAPNVARLLREVPESLEANPRVDGWELLCVDDGSRDATTEELWRHRRDGVRVLRLQGPQGKEAALAAGIDAARHEVVAFMDGDHQTSPDDLEPLLALLEEGYDLVNGIRERRRDGWAKRMSSRVAHGVRSRVLGDRFTDINCPLKVARRACLLEMPRFRAWHRYLPLLAEIRGHAVTEAPVRHFPRAAGRSKYGVWNRLWIGLRSLMVVRWLSHNRIEYRLEKDRDSKPS